MEKNRHLITITEGGGGSTVKPLGAENPAKGGGGSNWKNPQGGMDIFWNHSAMMAQLFLFKMINLFLLS